ncbi:hypothetical protein [Sanguibacter sp. HDW7]|uniref:hypothetical protein n=1 Tax=Sanguibacter sp. HDW7 TaxID=2714931 RepID=UPI00140D618F|nr:hypothetical protein [Sanguibacter sp. HDW7]QIK83392.1 hypothetical protein G7063_06960 [Sanguibacter sp. HDW7]
MPHTNSKVETYQVSLSTTCSGRFRTVSESAWRDGNGTTFRTSPPSDARSVLTV